MSGGIKATEARQISKDKSKIIAEKELEDVYGLIRNACSNGDYEVICNKQFSIHALKRLDELGYRYDILENGIKIKWYE